MAARTTTIDDHLAAPDEDTRAALEKLRKTALVYCRWAVAGV